MPSSMERFRRAKVESLFNAASTALTEVGNSGSSGGSQEDRRSVHLHEKASGARYYSRWQSSSAKTFKQSLARRVSRISFDRCWLESKLHALNLLRRSQQPLRSGQCDPGGGHLALSVEHGSRRQQSLRANVAGSACIFEAADGFGKHLLRQPKHDLRKEDRERDRDQEDAIDRQRRA